MDRNVIQINTRWYKWSDYELVDGVIKPVKGARSIEYNPFDNYLDRLRMKKPVKKTSPRENYIHASFANIDYKNENEILEWVKTYGVPYSYYVDSSGERMKCFPQVPPQRSNSFAKDMSDELSISEIVSEIQAFRRTINFYSLIRQKPINTSALRECINQIGFQQEYLITTTNLDDRSPSSAHKAFGLQLIEEAFEKFDKPCYGLEELQTFEEEYGGIENIIEEYIQNVLNITTQSVTEIVRFHGDQLQVTYQYGSLLALMYKMLVFDWTKSIEMRTCADNSCRRFFIPYHPSSIYCADECRNRVSAREYRQNHKQQIVQEQRVRRAKSKNERQA